MEGAVSLKQKAYQYIKNKIVDCEYAPDSFLNEKQLMEEIGVSRTPIREALSRLEQENLVSILPMRGVLVKGVSIEELNMVYQARELIEMFIIREHGQELDRGKLLEMRARIEIGIDQRTESELSKTDDDFHALITSVSGNSYLLNTLEHMHLQVLRFRKLAVRRDSKRLSRSRAEHLEIIDNLLRGDYEGAAQAVRAHLANARDVILQNRISI